METNSLEESVGGISEERRGVSDPSHLNWLQGSFLQSALCQVFQRFALEGDEENRRLVHKV